MQYFAMYNFFFLHAYDIPTDLFHIDGTACYLRGKNSVCMSIATMYMCMTQKNYKTTVREHPDQMLQDKIVQNCHFLSFEFLWVCRYGACTDADWLEIHVACHRVSQVMCTHV